MAYKMPPFGHDIHGQPFYSGNMSNPPVYCHHDDLLETEDSYMQNIDPLLRQIRGRDPWQQQQQQPLQKWITEPERAWFTAGPLSNRLQALPRNFMRPSDGVSSLPKARMVSPSPSQELSSQCSSARSPGAELDFYPDAFFSPQQDDYSFPNATSQFSQGLPDLSSWQERPQSKAVPQLSGYNYVNLNQVQGVPDLQDGNFETDEGYPDMDLKNEYCIEVDSKSHPTHSSYRHSPSDEGLGSSIKDEGSPQAHPSMNDAVTDADAEADLDDDDAYPPEEPASDPEYSPKNARSRKRRASKAASPPNIKRRMPPSKSPKKSPHTCKSCNHSPFKDAASLQRHINTSHTRAFVCVFGFAGCQSTFASKNEWKRHVSSQHLNLNSWVCELGSCGSAKTQSQKDGKGSEFNRKDLFTQHLRRMHAPFDVKRKNKKNPEWEERLKELQVSCLRVKRQPPSRLACPLEECDGAFEGLSCWDDRMEHVGKHLEKAAGRKGGEVRQEDDEMLVNWALRERIVERKIGGGFRLAGAWFETADDEDADGEDE